MPRSRTHTRSQLFKLLPLLPVILSLSLLSPVYVYIKYACIFFFARRCCVRDSFLLLFIIFWMNGLLVHIFFPG